MDGEGALRVPRGVVGGGGDAEDAFGGGGGWGWLKFAKVSLFVIREEPRCLSVSLCLPRFCWLEVGPVFRLSDGTLVCPVVDLVPRCCTSAEHDCGKGRKPKAKKVVGSGV